MAETTKQDIELGITRLEYGDAERPQRAVLQIETSKYYNGGLISDASVYWIGRNCRQQMIGLGGSGGDYSKRLIVSERTVRATKGNIAKQHAAAFTPEVVAGLTQAAKDHYAAAVRAGVDGMHNTYPEAVNA